MYTEVPVAQISTTLHKLSTAGVEAAAPAAPQVMAGTVKGLPARRYRLQYGPEAWIDVWTTDAIPENPQLRTVVDQFVRGISPATASVMTSLKGTPLYVELNFRRYKKLPLLRMKSLTWSDQGAADALKVGAFYFHAPLLDSLWK
jgi:hypothetical protein